MVGAAEVAHLTFLAVVCGCGCSCGFLVHVWGAEGLEPDTDVDDLMHR